MKFIFLVIFAVQQVGLNSLLQIMLHRACLWDPNPTWRTAVERKTAKQYACQFSLMRC